jgi:hypothetical protein
MASDLLSISGLLQTKLSLNFDGTRFLDRMWINLYQERRVAAGIGTFKFDHGAV